MMTMVEPAFHPNWELVDAAPYPRRGKSTMRCANYGLKPSSVSASDGFILSIADRTDAPAGVIIAEMLIGEARAPSVNYFSIEEIFSACVHVSKVSEILNEIAPASAHEQEKLDAQLRVIRAAYGNDVEYID